MPQSLRVIVCCLVVETVLPLVVAAQQLDQLGDPLPTGAVARLGTSRLRVRGSVYDATFHPNGGQLVTSDSQGRVAFWDSRSGVLLRKESTGASFVYQVSFSRNGDRLIAAGDGVIVVWDLETGMKLCSLQRATGRLGAADLSPDGTTLVAVDKDGALQFWRLTENGAEPTLRRAGSFVRVKYAPNGEWVLAADEGRLFRVRAGTGEISSQWDAHEGEIEDLDISPEGGQVVSAGDDGVFTVWEAKTGNRLWSVKDAHRRRTHSTVNSDCYSPDGKTLVTAGGDGIVRFWDVQSHKQIRSFEAGVQRKARWSPDGKRVAVFAGGSVRICDAFTGKDIPYLPGHQDFADQILFIDGGKLVMTVGHNDSSAIVWQRATGKVVHDFRQPPISRMAALLGTNQAVAAASGRLSIYDLKTGFIRELASLDDPNITRYWWPSISADSRRMLTTVPSTRSVIRDGRKTFDQDWQIVTWNLTTGEQLASRPSNDHRHQMHLSPDGKTILGYASKSSTEKRDGRSVSMTTHQLVTWPFEDLTKETTIWERTQDGYGVSGSQPLAVSPDSRLVALARGEEGVLLLELASGKVAHTLKPDGAFCSEVSFSEDGKFVLAGKHTFHLWDVDTGRKVQSFNPEEMSDVGVLSPDGRLLATGGTKLALWEVSAGHRLIDLPGHQAPVRRLVFSPDGKWLVSSASDAQTLVWSLDPKDWPYDKDLDEITSLKNLWQELGEHEASRAYAAAAKLIENPGTATTLLTELIPEAITLPAHPPYEDADVLRLHRAAYVLEQIGSKEASTIRNRIHYPRLQPKTFDPKKRRFDTFGDPLAEGAVLRLGTDRYYVSGRTARIAFSPDGSCIAVAGNDDMFGDAGRGVAERRNASLELWDPRTGKAIRRIDVPFPGGYPAMPIYTPDGKTIVCVAGKGVWLVDVAEGRIRKQWETDKAIYALTALSSDGRQVVLSHSNSSFRVYETETGISLGGAKLDGRVVSTTAVANNIVFVTYRRNVEQELSVWNVEKQEWVRREETPLQKSLAVSPDGRSYAKADRGNLIELRRVSDDKLLSKIELDTEEFQSRFPNRLLFTPDGKHLAAWPDHRVLTLFDTATGKSSSHIDCSAGEPLVFSADGRFVAQVSSNRLRAWEVASGHGLHTEFLSQFQYAAPCCSSDGGTLLRMHHNQCYVCDPHSLKPLSQLPLAGLPLALSRDGRFCLVLASGNTDYTVAEVATGTQVVELPRGFGRPRPVFAANGRQIVAAAEFRGNVSVVDLLTGQAVHTWQNPKALRSDVAISPDGRLVLGREGEKLLAFAAESGELCWSIERRRLRGTTYFSADGKKLLVPEYRPHGFTVYDAGNQAKQLETIKLGQNQKVLAVSPRMTTFLTADESGELAVYELASRELVGQLDAGSLSSVQYLDDDRHVLTRSDSGKSELWDLAALAAPRLEGETIEEQLQRLALDIASHDAKRAFAAAWAFVLASEQGLPILRAKLLDNIPDGAELRRLIKQLDDDNFGRREQATKELVAIGSPVLKLLDDSVTLESSREVKLRAERIKKVVNGTAGLKRRRAQWILRQVTGKDATVAN